MVVLREGFGGQFRAFSTTLDAHTYSTLLDVSTCKQTPPERRIKSTVQMDTTNTIKIIDAHGAKTAPRLKASGSLNHDEAAHTAANHHALPTHCFTLPYTATLCQHNATHCTADDDAGKRAQVAGKAMGRQLIGCKIKQCT